MKLSEYINESSWEKMHNYLTGRFEDEFGIVELSDLEDAVKKPKEVVGIKCASKEAVENTCGALNKEFDDFDAVPDIDKLRIIIKYKKG